MTPVTARAHAGICPAAPRDRTARGHAVAPSTDQDAPSACLGDVAARVANVVWAHGPLNGAAVITGWGYRFGDKRGTTSSVPHAAGETRRRPVWLKSPRRSDHSQVSLKSLSRPRGSPSARGSSRWTSTRRCTSARSTTPRASGPRWPRSISTGRRSGTRSSTTSSTRLVSSGSRAARPTSPTTASTGISRRGAATRPRSSGKTTRAAARSTRTSRSTTRCAASRTCSRSTASRRAIASPSTCR